MNIRELSAADQSSARDLIVSILESEYPFEKDAYSGSDLDSITAAYGGERDSFLVMETDKGKIVGTAAVKEENRSCALLRRLFLSAEYRGRGLGSELALKALDRARDLGYKKIVFRATDKMLSAISLCLKLGFAETEVFDIGGFNIHVLEKNL